MDFHVHQSIGQILRSKQNKGAKPEMWGEPWPKKSQIEDDCSIRLDQKKIMIWLISNDFHRLVIQSSSRQMQKVWNYIKQRHQKMEVFQSPCLFHSLLIFFTSSWHLLMLRLAPTQRPVWNFVGHRLEGKHPWWNIRRKDTKGYERTDLKIIGLWHFDVFRWTFLLKFLEVWLWICGMMWYSHERLPALAQRSECSANLSCGLGKARATSCACCNTFDDGSAYWTQSGACIFLYMCVCCIEISYTTYTTGYITICSIL